MSPPTRTVQLRPEGFWADPVTRRFVFSEITILGLMAYIGLGVGEDPSYSMILTSRHIQLYWVFGGLITALVGAIAFWVDVARDEGVKGFLVGATPVFCTIYVIYRELRNAQII
jgi:hypothetical protein